MDAIIKKEIEALLILLGNKATQEKKDLAMLISDIRTETIHDAKEGLRPEEILVLEKINGSNNIEKKLEELTNKERVEQLIETAASKIMVRYYANHKKNYSEKQKEIFLTFLLTNKMKRALQKYLGSGKK